GQSRVGLIETDDCPEPKLVHEDTTYTAPCVTRSGRPSSHCSGRWDSLDCFPRHRCRVVLGHLVNQSLACSLCWIQALGSTHTSTHRSNTETNYLISHTVPWRKSLCSHFSRYAYVKEEHLIPVNVWRRKYAQGEVVVIRFADDTIVGFQYQTDADHFLENLRERLGKFGLELHPDKTRRIEFGRFAQQNRERRGEGKPETFDFLGFTHISGKNRLGRFTVRRKTIRKRMVAKLR